MQKLLLLVAAAFLLASCAHDDFDKIPRTAFIQHYVHDEDNRTPFLSYWENGNTKEWNARVEGSHGKKQVLYVKDINTAYLTPQPKDDNEKKDLESLKVYFRTSLNKHLQAATKQSSSFIVSPKQTHDAYTLEVAITSITPSKPVGNALASGLGNIKPGLGLTQKLVPKGKISVAAKLKDNHGKIIAEMADYNEDKSSILIDFKDFTRYGHHKSEIDQWCREFTDALTHPADHKIKRRPFWLNPF
jgi:hypothetical protein